MLKCYIKSWYKFLFSVFFVALVCRYVRESNKFLASCYQKKITMQNLLLIQTKQFQFCKCLYNQLIVANSSKKNEHTVLPI